MITHQNDALRIVLEYVNILLCLYNMFSIYITCSWFVYLSSWFSPKAIMRFTVYRFECEYQSNDISEGIKWCEMNWYKNGWQWELRRKTSHLTSCTHSWMSAEQSFLLVIFSIKLKLLSIFFYNFYKFLFDSKTLTFFPHSNGNEIRVKKIVWNWRCFFLKAGARLRFKVNLLFPMYYCIISPFQN